MSETAHRFCKLLKEAIDDEDKADVEYGELTRAGINFAQGLPKARANAVADDIETILKIKDDENRHETVLTLLHERYCGGTR